MKDKIYCKKCLYYRKTVSPRGSEGERVQRDPICISPGNTVYEERRSSYSSFHVKKWRVPPGSINKNNDCTNFRSDTPFSKIIKLFSVKRKRD